MQKVKAHTIGYLATAFVAILLFQNCQKADLAAGTAEAKATGTETSTLDNGTTYTTDAASTATVQKATYVDLAGERPTHGDPYMRIDLATNTAVEVGGEVAIQKSTTDECSTQLTEDESADLKKFMSQAQICLPKNEPKQDSFCTMAEVPGFAYFWVDQNTSVGLEHGNDGCDPGPHFCGDIHEAFREFTRDLYNKLESRKTCKALGT